MLYDEYTDPLVTFGLGRAYLSGPKISGGMTDAQFQAQLKSQQDRFDQQLQMQNQSVIEQEKLRQMNDEMLAARETQRAAAEAAAISEAQKLIANETKAKKKDTDIQSSFDALFTSFIQGTTTGTGDQAVSQ